ncbi:MAG: hypothetical protein HKN36_11085 [Hellea sp.]|nr:hypothetical protein [Hellea sp.]
MSVRSRHNQSVGGSIIFVLFLIGAVLTLGLYYVKTNAQTAKAEAAQLQRLVSAELAAIKVLKAELAHLESPARLSELSASRLGFSSIEVKQTLTLKDIESVFPLKDQPEANP